MKAFTEPLKALGEFESIRDSLKKQKGMTEVQGCIDAQKAHFIYGLSEDFLFRVIVTYSELRAREIYDNYRCFDKDVLLFPARDLIFYSADIHSSLIVQQLNPGAGEDSLGKRRNHHHDDGKLYGSPASAGRVSEKYPENRRSKARLISRS